ncbi:Rap1 GTPase-GDP dissociation stimulator 1-A, partial [Xenoophorus captivus]
DLHPLNSSCPLTDVIKLQLVEAGLVECLLEVVGQTVDGEREEDIAQLKTASDLMVLLLLGGKHHECLLISVL